MFTGKLRKVALAVFLAWLPAGRVEAERITFRSGGVVVLPASTQGDQVRVLAPEGEYLLDRKALASVETEGDPDLAWPAIAREARSGAADDRLSAACWAIDHGLVAEGVAMLRESGSSSPLASRMLAALERLDAPCPAPDLARVRASLGGTFQETRGPHVVLLHQHDPERASARVAYLENVLTAFYLEFARLGYELKAPREPLVSVWYAEQADYRAFLRREGAEAFLNTRGYHHPTRRLVVAFDERSQGSYRKSLAAIERMAAGPERDRRRLLLEESRRRVDLGTSSHETVHQLVVASGLAPHHDDFPGWLDEGLAMQFEAVRGDRWGGLGSPSPIRLADWEGLSPRPGLRGLLDDSGFHRGYRREPYAQAWAFVFFLRTRRPEELVRLIDDRRAPGSVSEGASGRARLEALEAAFRDARLGVPE